MLCFVAKGILRIWLNYDLGFRRLCWTPLMTHFKRKAGGAESEKAATGADMWQWYDDGGRGPGPRNMLAISRTRKSEETNSPLQPPGRMYHCWYLYFPTSETESMRELKGINVACLKCTRLWCVTAVFWDREDLNLTPAFTVEVKGSENKDPPENDQML